MLTITVIAEGGASISHTDPEVIVSVVADWETVAYPAPREAVELIDQLGRARTFEAFAKAVRARDYQSAGIHGERLGLSLGLDVWPNTVMYVVPVDPADETNCESCQ